MANQKRKVSFYYLSLEKQTFIKERNTTQIMPLSNEEIEEYFKKIYDKKMLELENGNKAVDVDTTYSNYVIEIIEYTDHLAFAKIGQQNYANTVALRDKNTLETEDVPMSATQLLELYTFCLIDFETGIVSYIGINGAPRISAVRGLFDKFLHEENVYAKLAAIMTNDILQTLVQKNIISKLSLTVAVPNDEVLSDTIGLSSNDFDALRNVKTRTATYKLVATRNKNIFQSSGKLAELIATIKNKFGNNLRGLTVNAKNLNESSQTYDLLQYNFTKTVTLGGEDHSVLLEDDFKAALRNTYISNKDELLKYI
ncbi:hypothetical protein ACRQV7_00825 [Caproiciproducens sp. R2]|uniref:hypothetical protein n=1 Tax=Caproiciproducens sp. R2 TaxID=3435187 RepID=UPI004033FFDB